VPGGYQRQPGGYPAGRDSSLDRPGTVRRDGPGFYPAEHDGLRPAGQPSHPSGPDDLYRAGPDGQPGRTASSAVRPGRYPGGADGGVPSSGDYPPAGGPQATGLRPLPPDLRPRGNERPPQPALPAADSDRPEAAARTGNGHVPSPIERLVQASARQQGVLRNEDEEMTRPLPVILPGANTVPRPAHVEAPRGPFEPARPDGGELPPDWPSAGAPPGGPAPGQSEPARPVSVTGSVEPPSATFAVREPSPRPNMIPAPVQPPAERVVPRDMPDAAVAKLHQIKDLYLTAEAIGEDALDKHFEQVSQRQRELIREFFDKSERPGGQG
jgi:hypothetical protein